MKTFKKPMTLLLAFLMVFSSLLTAIPVFGAETATVAEWNYTTAPSSAQVPATGGVHQSGALLTNSMGKTPGYSTTSLAVSGGWEAGSQYWQLSFSTEGYESLTLSAKTRSSGTGPRDFQVQYSVDGTEFTSIEDSEYSITGTALSNYMRTISLPDEVNDTDTVYIRFVVTSTVSEGGGTVAGTGVSNINNVIVRGTPAEGGSTPEIDKTALTTAIDAAQDILDAAEVGSEPGQYPQAAYDAFDDAIAAAEAVRDDADATQDETDDAVTALNAAVAVFEAAAVATPGGPTIAEARMLPVGAQVTVRGVVARSVPSSAGSQNNCTVFIEDGTAGIGIYNSSAFSPTTYAPGTTLNVSGALSLYNGLLEISPAVVTVDGSVPVTPVTPQVVTVVQLMTGDYQGQLVKILGATLTSEGTASNHTISQNGASTTLRCTGTSTLENFGVNDVIDAVGVAGVFNGTAQLLVQSESDISLTGEGIGAVTATPSGGAIAPGDTVTLSTTTSGATIQYSINDGAYQTYTTPFAITTLPATVKAYAEKDGVTGSTATFNYTQTAPGGPTIAQVRTMPIGAQATVRGVVTRSVPSSAGSQNNCTVFIEDGTAGIGIYNSSAFSPTTYAPGTTLNVSGALSLYNGLLEISPAVVMVDGSVPVTPVTPQVVTVVQLMTGDYQGQLVKILGATLTSEGTASNHTILQNGASTTLRCTGTSTLENFGVNDVIDAVGVAGVFNGTAQLLVQSESDISLAGGGIGAVTATPSGGAIEPGDTIALSTTTSGATIKYSVNNGAYQTYAAPFAITTLPATVKAYAEKDGVTGSTATFNYTLKQAAVVKASPNGGNVEVGATVILTCETADATIKYSTDGGSTYQTYAGPLTIPQLPFVIKAYAVKTGLADGPAATFTYGDVAYNFYFGQLHSHTNISDGQGSIQEAFSYAKNSSGVDFLAVTDHSNWFDDETTATMAGSDGYEWKLGHNTADAYTDNNFVGIYGFEMTWSDGTGHINTFNTPGYESRNNEKFKETDGLQQYYNILKQYPDSISQFNHPGTVFGDFRDFANYDTQIDKQISLIEVGNGEGPVRGAGYFPSYEYYTRALDKGWHVAPANNQDNHKGKWGNSNTARTVALADSLTRENIYDAMKEMRIYATEDDDLEIMYTLNDSVMGSILGERPDEVNIEVALKDPDGEALGKVSVIVNGGRVAASKTISSSEETVSFTLAPDYSYYYIRIDEADKDIAVTAPVWIDDVEAVGISKTTASTTLPLKGDQITIHSDLYNNGDSALTINSLTYSIDGNVIHTAAGLAQTLAPYNTAKYEFPYTFTAAGSYTINIQLTGTLGGIQKTYNDVLRLTVGDPALVSKVVVDASHSNDYVSGYYANNVSSFITLANQENVAVYVENNELTDASLENAQLLVISAPAKKSGSSDGVAYSPSKFSEDDLAVIKRFVDNGGNLMLMGIADYQDGTGEYQTSTQMNRLLTKIGATTRFNNDEVADYTNNLSNQFYRLAFNNYNMASPYLDGVVADQQNYSFYSGCSLALNADALASGKTTWLVKGHSTTGSVDSNGYLTGVNLPNGSVYALATEKLNGGGEMFIGGTVFISNFEVKANIDHYGELQNSNYNITMNILDSVKKDIEVTPIATIREAEIGSSFMAEGIVTAGTAPGNAFFDTIYIQDATGGINLFPVSQPGIMVGQKVRVTGTVDEYQGDLELRVTDLEVTDTSINPKAPTRLSAADAMNSLNGGLLTQVSGRVTRVEKVGGVVSEIFIDDGSGAEARVFIDGYIGYSDESSPKLEDTVTVGATVTAVGLASADPSGARIRVRDRSEIAATPAPVSINRVGITVASYTILNSDRNIVFRISADDLQDVWTMEGKIKIEDTGSFVIKSIVSLYTGTNVVFQRNVDYAGDGTTAYFNLSKVGGFEDAGHMDIAEVTIQMKEGATADSLKAILDSFNMYRGNPDHTATKVSSEITQGAAITHIYVAGRIGDLSGDGVIDGNDLTIALTYFGYASTDADWYSSGAWKADLYADGIIDIVDITIEAGIVARPN